MKLEFDEEADAIYVTLRKGKVSKTEAAGDYLIDYDGKGRPIGLEVLCASGKIKSLKRKAVAVVQE